MKWFISYCRRDSTGELHPVHDFVKRDVAPLVRASLGQHGLGEVYSDHDDDQAPQWRKRIVEHLRASDGVIALVDYRYLESDWCRFELEVGLQLHANRGGVDRLILLPLTRKFEDLRSKLAASLPALGEMDGPDLLHRRIGSGPEGVSPVYAGDVPWARAMLATRIDKYVVDYIKCESASPVAWPPELQAKAEALLRGKGS